jgi:hypothetical protein
MNTPSPIVAPGWISMPVGDEARQPAQAAPPQPVGAAMQHQRVQPRVTRDHLPLAAGGRVAVEDALDVGAQAAEHGVLGLFGPEV